MELLGIGPNWLLIWLVTWSLRHSLLQSAIAGLILGLIQDGMTGFYPSHIIGFGCIGFLTAWIGKQRYLQEGLISLLLLVFAMAVVAETATAIQYSLSGMRPLAEIWQEYQRIALSSAILTSLWAPALYYPLNYWWNSKVN